MTLGMVRTLQSNTKGTIMKQVIAKLDFSKMKNFCSMKDNVKRIR